MKILFGIILCFFASAALSDEVVNLTPGNSVTIGSTLVRCNAEGGGGTLVFFSCKDGNSDGVWYAYVNYKDANDRWQSETSFEGGSESECNRLAANVGICQSSASSEIFYCKDGNNDGEWWVYSATVTSSGLGNEQTIVAGGSKDACFARAKAIGNNCG